MPIRSTRSRRNSAARRANFASVDEDADWECIGWMDDGMNVLAGSASPQDVLSPASADREKLA
jgi:hypothetical protein